MCRCCNTCDDVREAYRRRGWAFKNADTIEQCKREGFTQKMQEQKNEGCQVYGFLEVNKVPTLISGLLLVSQRNKEQQPRFCLECFRNVLGLKLSSLCLRWREIFTSLQEKVSSSLMSTVRPPVYPLCTHTQSNKGF